MRIFDSHVHLFDPEQPGGIVWPADDSSLYRPTMPSDLVAASKPLDVTECIAVETSRRPIDDQWLLKLADKTPMISGVVLNLQPDLPGFETRLDAALESDKFVGIRLRPIERYDLSAATLLSSFSLLEKSGKTVEFGAKTNEQKSALADLAERHSGTSWILDHFGHPKTCQVIDGDWLALAFLLLPPILL